MPTTSVRRRISRLSRSFGSLLQACFQTTFGNARNTLRYAARQDWDRIARDLEPVYTAVNAKRRSGW